MSSISRYEPIRNESLGGSLKCPECRRWFPLHEMTHAPGLSHLAGFLVCRGCKRALRAKPKGGRR